MNWHDRINRAIKNGGRFRDEDKRLAARWVTCACGEQDGIPRGERGLPHDNRLVTLGCLFSTYVNDDCPLNAQITLRSIEFRAAEILEGV